MRLTDFTALSFDCYGTLIDWESGMLATLRPWADRRGIVATDDELLAAFSRTEPQVQAERPAVLYPEILAETFRRVGAALGQAVEEAEARAFGHSVKDWPAFADSADALAYLKRRYKLAILSNVDRASFAHSNRKLGVEFDLVVTAEDVGSYKPTPRNFEVLLERLAALGVPKERVLHTAESLFHDHVPAKRFGLVTAWINRRSGKGSFGATRAPDQSVKPDWKFPTLAALAELHRKQTAG
jgi:putative hydrolase of the HAD superfamily